MFLRALLLSIWFVSLSLYSEETREPLDAIFMGVHLQAQLGEDFIPIAGYDEGAWLIDSSKGLQSLPPNTIVHMRKILRHSERFAKLYDIEVLPISSEEMNKVRAMNIARQEMVSQQDRLDQLIVIQAGGSEDQLVGQDFDTTNEPSVLADPGVDEMISNTQDNIDAFQSAFEAAEEGIYEPDEQFDILRTRVKLEARSDLNDCFIIARIKFHSNPKFSPELDAEEERGLYQVFPIGNLIAGREKTITFALSGFPPGPDIIETQYHLFSESREVPTNFSDQLITVSSDEAFDFLYADFVSREDLIDQPPHQFKPLPKSTADHLLPNTALDSIKLNIRVNPMGYVDEISIIDSPAPLKDEVIDFLKTAKFFPAIQGGLPTDQEIQLSLQDLLL